jgi:hypothetical protein
MKRLFFKQSKDKKNLYTEEILCEKDVLKGEIYLGSLINWMVIDSKNAILNSGIATSVESAKKKIKNVLNMNGAKFDKEYRKYKI